MHAALLAGKDLTKIGADGCTGFVEMEDAVKESYVRHPLAKNCTITR